VHPLAGLQKSFVHPFPSVHTALSPVWTHPVAGLQVSIVQGIPSSHEAGGPPAHADPLHVSPVVHGLPSLQVPGSTICVNSRTVLLSGLRSDEALVTDADVKISPLPAHWIAFTTTVMTAGTAGSRRTAVHPTDPVPPGEGDEHAHPAGAATETKVVLGGVAIVNAGASAVPGPLSTTVAVYTTF
jgi:hypothetical protein